MTKRDDVSDVPNRDIWIGDVLVAWRRLGLKDPIDRAAAAEALGFNATELRRAAVDPAVADVELPPLGIEGMAGGMVDIANPGAAGRVIPSLAEQDDAAASTAPPAWLTDAPSLSAEQAAHQTWKPSRLPLLRRQWTRHILSAVSAVTIEEGTIDEARLIDTVSRLRPIKRMPRRRRPTLRRGTHVLLDRGKAMMPFAYDVQEVLAQLRSIVGREHLAVAAFEFTPLAGVHSLRHGHREPWNPPAPGTPILLITDLGLSQRYGAVRGATPDEWLAFAARCRAAGCTVVALVPRGEPSWPPALRKVFTIIPWDHRTTVSTVMRYLRSSEA